MSQHSFPSPSRLAVIAAVILPSLLMALTGCSNMVTTAAETNTFPQAAEMTGTLHGGSQPIIGATVKLYAAGSAGYGKGATLYATATTIAPGGSFQFTKASSNTGVTNSAGTAWGCPTSGNPQMYLVASGGNTSGSGTSTNSAAVFAVAIGDCNDVTSSTYVNLNEATTVATMAALQQYFNPNTEQFGSPATTQAQAGLNNAVAVIPNLVNIAGGYVLASNTVTATPAGQSASVTVTVTPETKKINTIANILASCVNQTTSSNTSCNTLFADALPPAAATTSQPGNTYTTPTDVLQAAYFMLTNPASGSAANMSALFGLSSADAPFLPALSTAPTDWTIAVRYDSTSACTSGTFLGGSYDLAIDADGNLWAAGNSTNGNLMELSPAGKPLVCDLGTSVATAKSLTIDTSRHVWIASNSTSFLYKYSQDSDTSTAWATLHIPYSVTADGSGNVFYSSVTGTELDEFAGAATASTAATAKKVGAVGSGPFYLSPDTAGNLWVLQTASTASLYQVYPSTVTTASTYNNGYQTSIVASTSGSGDTGHITNPYGIAAGLGGKMAIINGSNTSSTVSNTLALLTPNATPGSAATVTDTAQYAAANQWGRVLAADGAGNLWTVSSTSSGGNYVTGATSPAQYMLNEFSATGTALSPTGTLNGTKPTGGYQKDSTIFPTASYPQGPRGVAVDPSGNVWVGNNSTDGSGTGIVELVGAGVPTVTPISAALAAGAGTGTGSSMP